MPEIRIFRVTDAEMLTSLDAIRADFQGPSHTGLGIRFGDHVKEFSVQMPDEISAHPVLQQIVPLEAALVERFTMVLQPNITLQVHRKVEGFDTYNVSFPQNTEPELAARALAACARHFRALDRSDAITKMLGAELAEFYQRREEAVLRLEQLNDQLLRQNSAYRQSVDQETSALREKLQDEIAVHRDKLRTDFDQQESTVKARAAALDTREKDLDDRQATHARRRIHTDMKARLQDREKEFSLTERTVAKRRPVHLLFTLILATLVVLLGWGVWDTSVHGVQWNGTPYDWLRLLRIPIGALALAGFVMYYIRWNDQWFRQHASEEFRLKRLDLDIDRANWMVETMLEWKGQGVAIPPELIDRLSHNLFAASDGDRIVRHPAHDLLSTLLRASTSVTVPLPFGGNATLNAKGIKQLEKETKEE